MPVTDRDARALAYLAGRIRSEATDAPRWDQAGIDSICASFVGQGLVPTLHRVAGHAADRDAKTPGAMKRPFVPNTERDTTPRPPRKDECCRICGRYIDGCLCERPTTRPTQPSERASEHVAALRARLKMTEETP